MLTTHPDWATFENDIPQAVAQDAYWGTSHVPEQRGEQERRNYGETLRGDWGALYRLADTDYKRETLAQEFARYRKSYKFRTLARLSAKSRCVSTMIAGPANFNVRQGNKRCDTADNRTRELIEFRERALKAIRRTLCPDDALIMTGDADAGERLADKIKAAEQERDMIKAANAAARKTGIGPLYPSYKLTNLGANIRRMKDRASYIEQNRATPATTVQGMAARIEDVPQDNRIRLFFPNKPETGIRDELKHHGFRWTPSLGCWQAYRNQRATDVARRLAGLVDIPAPAPLV